MLTAARPALANSAHWYHPDGSPCFEVPRADGNGMRNTDLRDARKLGLLPSVTTIQQVLSKPGLTNWIVEQNILAIVTAPDVPGETLHDKVKRVLPDADQERDAAASVGTRVHAALANIFLNIDMPVDPDIAVMVGAGYREIKKFMDEKELTVVAAEEKMVGHGFAGCTDLVLSGFACFYVLDFKTCKTTDKEKKLTGWPEHRSQLGAYAALWCLRHNLDPLSVSTANVYISTTQPGRCEIVQHEDWRADYAGFRAMFDVWCWLKGYTPNGVVK